MQRDSIGAWRNMHIAQTAYRLLCRDSRANPDTRTVLSSNVLFVAQLLTTVHMIRLLSWKSLVVLVSQRKKHDRCLPRATNRYNPLNTPPKQKQAMDRNKHDGLKHPYILSWYANTQDMLKAYTHTQPFLLTGGHYYDRLKWQLILEIKDRSSDWGWGIWDIIFVYMQNARNREAENNASLQ